MKTDLEIRAYARVGRASDIVAVLGINSKLIEAIASFLQSLGKKARVGSTAADMPILHVKTDAGKSYMVTNRDYIVLDYAKKLTVTKRHSLHGTHRRAVYEDTSEFMTELRNLWHKTLETCETVTSDIKPIHPKKKVRHPARKLGSVKDKCTAAVAGNLTLDELTTAWTTFRDALQAKVRELEEKEAFFKHLQCELEQLVNESPIKR
jgi:hypothetical protein